MHDKNKSQDSYKNKSQDSYNKWGFYIFIGTTVFNCLWASYFIFFKNSIDLGEYKNQITQIKKQDNWTSEEQAKPWIHTQALQAYGHKIYKAQCALCHGTTGLGDGTPGLVPPPRNLVQGRWTKGGSSKDLFLTLNRGISGTSMQSFKHLPKKDLWALVHYVRSITKNKIQDDIKKLEKFATE